MAKLFVTNGAGSAQTLTEYNPFNAQSSDVTSSQLCITSEAIIANSTIYNSLPYAEGSSNADSLAVKNKLGTLQPSHYSFIYHNTSTSDTVLQQAPDAIYRITKATNNRRTPVGTPRLGWKLLSGITGLALFDGVNNTFSAYYNSSNGNIMITCKIKNATIPTGNSTWTFSGFNIPISNNYDNTAIYTDSSFRLKAINGNVTYRYGFLKWFSGPTIVNDIITELKIGFNNNSGSSWSCTTGQPLTVTAIFNVPRFEYYNGTYYASIGT